ncbi:hypothetical protein GN956_G1624 [Arapaima gigas]
MAAESVRAVKQRPRGSVVVPAVTMVTQRAPPPPCHRSSVCKTIFFHLCATKMAGIRRTERQQRYMSAAVSSSRLRHVQALLRDSNEPTPDAILCPLGIDSRYNQGCYDLARYLLFGLYKQSHLHQDFEFPEELLDDVILLIKADSVHLYCNPISYTSILPYISPWRNLHLYCMTEAEYEDEEAAEEFKISSFVNMVRGCSHIGVPYSSRGYAQKFDMFAAEKWPIIQAFALEGIGGGGFFTMKHKLTDVSEKLWKIYSRMDPVSLETLLTEDLVMFEKQWISFFSNFDTESYTSILELSEAQAGEPFRTYFSHGLISSQINDQSNRWQPFVLFGNHSTREDLSSYCFTFPSEGHQVRNTGPLGTTAKHMVLQCVSPKGPLSCARTYFFGTPHVPCLGTVPCLFLSQVYEAAVHAVLAGIKSFCSTSSASKAKDMAEQAFQASLEIQCLNQFRTSLIAVSVFNLSFVFNISRIIPLENADSRFMVKTASMEIYDIADPLGREEKLGSLVFSESFLESVLYGSLFSLYLTDDGVSSDSSFTILTSAVPRYVCWLVDESEVRLSEEVQQLLKDEVDTFLGTALWRGDSALVLSSSPLSTPVEGKISFFSEGILFIHPHCGSVTLPRSHIGALRFLEGDSSSTATALFLEYKGFLLPHLPLQLRSASCALAFALQSKSKAYKSFYSQVVSVWQQQTTDSGLVLQTVGKEQLSPEQRTMLSRLNKLSERRALPFSECDSPLKATSASLPELDTFLQHFALSSVGQKYLQRNHLEVLLDQREPATQHKTHAGQIVVTILTGIPGSSKESLCNFLVNTNKSSGSWAVYHPALERGESFCHVHFKRYLSFLVQSQMSTVSHRVSRVLVLTPGYTDVVDVVQALLTHPDPETREAFSVGAITACVDPLGSYMEHRYLFPKLLEQCSHGMVNAVVFTGLTKEPGHPLLQEVQQLVRAANPRASFILAEKGVVTRKEDMELILSKSSFSEPQMTRVRYLLYPGLNEGKFYSGLISPIINHQCVTFSRPLDRPLFSARCKELRSSLKPNPFGGNIYHIQGTVKFSDLDMLMDVGFSTLSGTLSLVPALEGSSPPAGSYLLQFEGVGLTQEGLKTWLRHCTQPKPAKKALKTKKTLTLQEIKMIHVEHHLDPLPSGYFYNGNQFVNFFGEKMTFHPLMEQFIDQYVEKANEEIEMFNKELEGQGQWDLFDP